MCIFMCMINSLFIIKKFKYVDQKPSVAILSLLALGNQNLKSFYPLIIRELFKTIYTCLLKIVLPQQYQILSDETTKPKHPLLLLSGY